MAELARIREELEPAFVRKGVKQEAYLKAVRKIELLGGLKLLRQYRYNYLDKFLGLKRD